MWGAERTQSSYTSGTWEGDKTKVFDEQGKFWIPWNTISSEIKHDMRLFISMLQEEPYVYQISKVKNTSPKGIVTCTVEQVELNKKTDYVNLETGEMYADYYVSSVDPVDEPINPVEPTKDNHMEIQCTTNKVRIGGNYKTLTAVCLNSDGDDISAEFNNYEWSFFIDDIDVSNLINVQEVDKNKIKIKISKMDNIDELNKYLNKVLVVKCKNEELESSVELYTTL
jgi:hypothetical protein